MSSIARKPLSKDVTTAGTAVALSATGVGFQELVIQAKSTNTWTIYVWDSTVSSSLGVELTALSNLPLTGWDLKDVYIDSSVNGEGVNILYKEV